MITDFKGKTAVLTGAAPGFGLCARIAAAQRGINVVLVDVQQDRRSTRPNKKSPLWRVRCPSSRPAPTRWRATAAAVHPLWRRPAPGV
jgi:NAD(P)-dependent dehydrogenase (short-subunit alcohol dehydrogenase family)